MRYGENCIDDFIDLLLKSSNKIIMAYNGSAFDYYFLINLLAEKKAKIDSERFIISNGKILGFRFGENNKVFDLCRFVMSSLDDACGSFNIKNAKSTFDHNRVKSFVDANKEDVKADVIPYLKLDVLALEELFNTFSNMIWGLFQINITSYFTLTHMAYAIWSNKLKYNIELFKSQEKYDFTKKGTFGARCMPNQKLYKSEHYDKIKEQKMTYEELLQSKGFMFNADATSLYPCAMSGFEHLEVKYPVGMSRWSEEPEKEFNANKLGYYEVEFQCNKKLRVPILPRKVNGGLNWSLHDGIGVYTCVDIRNALRHGYKIKFINKCLVWDESGPVFKEYVEKFYQLKESSEREENEVLRSICKLFLNGMFGKTLQRQILSSTTICSNINDYLSFCDQNDITDYTIWGSNRMIVTGEAKNKVEKITKPVQLGGFVLAYSRSIMYFYMEAIDPTLESLIFTYTDTDSIHMTGENYLKLKGLGYIKDKKSSKLGFLCSDIKNEGLIINEVNLAPKSYMYEYIDSKNLVNGEKNKPTMKQKGIPIGNKATKETFIKPEYFDGEARKIEFSGLKKKSIKLTSKDKNCEIKQFSIISVRQCRTMSKSLWKGMELKGNEWFPFGYDHSLDEEDTLESELIEWLQKRLAPNQFDLEYDESEDIEEDNAKDITAISTDSDYEICESDIDDNTIDV